MSGHSYSSSTCNFIRSFFQKARRGVGSCFSTTPSSRAAAGAGRPQNTTVIKPDGSLMEYSLPIRVRYVLLTTQCLSSVLCDTDELSYDGYVQALDSDHLLRPGNVYFVLPKKSLKYPLTAAEMAALASRANSALSKAASMESKKKNRGRGSASKGVRILPLSVSDGYERLNEDCVFRGGDEVPIAEVLDACKTPNADGNTSEGFQNLPAKQEDFDDDDGGEMHSGDDELDKLLEEMAKRNKNQMKQNFYRKKRFSPTLSTIPEDHEV